MARGVTQRSCLGPTGAGDSPYPRRSTATTLKSRDSARNCGSHIDRSAPSDPRKTSVGARPCPALPVIRVRRSVSASAPGLDRLSPTSGSPSATGGSGSRPSGSPLAWTRSPSATSRPSSTDDVGSQIRCPILKFNVPLMSIGTRI